MHFTTPRYLSEEYISCRFTFSKTQCNRPNALYKDADVETYSELQEQAIAS